MSMHADAWQYAIFKTRPKMPVKSVLQSELLLTIASRVELLERLKSILQL